MTISTYRNDAQAMRAQMGYLALPPAAQRKAFIREGLRTMGYRRDSAEGVTLSRQLESLWAKTFEVKRTPLAGRRFVPRDTETAPWAETYRYRVFDTVGSSVLLKTYNERLPRTSAVASETTGRIWGYGTAIGWNEMERMQAIATNTNLPSAEMSAAQRVLEQDVDTSIAFGDADIGTSGLLNNTYVPVLALPAGQSSSTYWTGKTGSEVTYDLDLIYQTVKSQSGETETISTIVLPPRALGYIRTTPWSEYGETSILEYFMNSHKDVEVVDEWDRCNTAGVGSTPRLVAYRQSSEHLRAIVPMEFTMMPLERRGFQYEAPAHVRVGGVEWLFPLAGVYADNFWNPALV